MRRQWLLLCIFHQLLIIFFFFLICPSLLNPFLVPPPTSVHFGELGRDESFNTQRVFGGSVARRIHGQKLIFGEFTSLHLVTVRAADLSVYASETCRDDL